MTQTYVDVESPFTGGKVLEIRDVEEKTFRGEKYLVNVRYFQCEDSGEQFTTPEQDELWTNELYGQYRSRHGIPSPKEIKAVRETYGFNYSQMSRLLGFGINQLKNYEDGQVPSESNGKMLRIAADPLTMMNLLEISRNELSDSEFDQLRKKIAVVYFEQARKRGNTGCLLSDPSGSFM